MRLLAATSRSNGDRPGDYTFGVEGELVHIQDPCSRDSEDPDGGCGCGRGFSGMSTHRATTTALVVDSPLSSHDVREALRASLEDGGWLRPDSGAEADAVLDAAIDDITAVAEHFPVGSIVRRRLSQYYTDGASA